MDFNGFFSKISGSSKYESKKIEKKDQLRCIKFNQPHTRISAISKQGIFVFSLNPIKVQWKLEQEEVLFVEQIFETSIIAFVSIENPFKLVLFDFKSKEIIQEVDESDQIVGVRCTELFFFLMFHNKIKVYTKKKMNVIGYYDANLDSKNDPENLHRICVTSEKNDVIATKCKEIGKIKVLNFTKQRNIEIKAHKTEISVISMNKNGSIVATSSKKGTLIRIFDTKTKDLLQELRRGTFSARIYCLAFSNFANDLCCCSERGTIHIFSYQLKKKENQVNDLEKSVQKTTSNRTSKFSVLGFLGLSFFNSEWSKLELKSSLGDGKCCFQSNNEIIFLSNNGIVSTIKFDDTKASFINKEIDLSKILGKNEMKTKKNTSTGKITIKTFN